MAICGPTKDNIIQQYHTRTNTLEEQDNHPHIIKIIKLERASWARHVKSQKYELLIKLVWEEVPDRERALGRPRLLWRELKIRFMNINY